MIKPIANFFSFIFHPLLLPTYGALVIINANPDIFNYLNIRPDMLMLRVIANTLIFPVIIILLAKPLGLIKSFYMKERHERIIPYVATLFFYIWTCFSFYKEGYTPKIFNVILLGALIALIFAFMANALFMKVSIHTVGMGVLIGLMLALMPSSEKAILPVLIVSLLIAGAVGTARLILQSHTQKEIYVGYLIGLLSQLIAIQFIF